MKLPNFFAIILQGLYTGLEAGGDGVGGDDGGVAADEELGGSVLTIVGGADCPTSYYGALRNDCALEQSGAEAHIDSVANQHLTLHRFFYSFIIYWVE